MRARVWQKPPAEIFNDCHAIQEQIRPVLELNRFRQKVQAIKQEPNAKRRDRLFAETLLGDQVRESLSACYMLLTEIPELLVQLSSCHDQLMTCAVSEGCRQ